MRAPAMRAAARLTPPTQAEAVGLNLATPTAPNNRYAEGANYTIDVEGMMAVCRVRCRRDLSLEEGARLASEKVSLFRKLASGDTKAMLFELSAAPTVFGPKTQEALGKMFAVWQLVDKPIAVVAGPNALQQLQLRRLAASVAQVSAVFETETAARNWLRARLG